MRILYLTLPALLDTSLCFIEEMSQLVNLHVLLQVTPNAWNNCIFDLPPVDLPEGLNPAEPVLKDYPPALQKTWSFTGSFKLAVFGGNSSVEPRSWDTAWQVVQYAQRLKPDLIHLETTLGRMAWALPWLKQVSPIILSVHDPQPHSGEAPLKKKIIRALTFGQVNHFILHNQAQMPGFLRQQRLAAKRVSVIPLGAYHLYRQFIQQQLPADPACVLFFGRLSPYKGLETLIRAAPMVCEKVPGARFVIAGRAIPGYELPVLPELPNGGRWDVMNKYIPNDMLANLFQQAAVVVCPYTDATQSGVVLTAYAFGKPVVASRVGGLPEYVQDGVTGALAEPGNATSLADGLVQVLSSPIGQEAISARIAAFCEEQLAWKGIAEKTLDIYQRCCKEQKREGKQ